MSLPSANGPYPHIYWLHPDLAGDVALLFTRPVEGGPFYLSWASKEKRTQQSRPPSINGHDIGSVSSFTGIDTTNGNSPKLSTHLNIQHVPNGRRYLRDLLSTMTPGFIKRWRGGDRELPPFEPPEGGADWIALPVLLTQAFERLLEDNRVIISHSKKNKLEQKASENIDFAVWLDKNLQQRQGQWTLPTYGQETTSPVATEFIRELQEEAINPHLSPPTEWPVDLLDIHNLLHQHHLCDRPPSPPDVMQVALQDGTTLSLMDCGSKIVASIADTDHLPHWWFWRELPRERADTLRLLLQQQPCLDIVSLHPMVDPTPHDNRMYFTGYRQASIPLHRHISGLHALFCGDESIALPFLDAHSTADKPLWRAVEQCLQCLTPAAQKPVTQSQAEISASPPSPAPASIQTDSSAPTVTLPHQATPRPLRQLQSGVRPGVSPGIGDYAAALALLAGLGFVGYKAVEMLTHSARRLLGMPTTKDSHLAEAGASEKGRMELNRRAG